MNFYRDLPPQLPKAKQATATVDELINGNLKLVVCIAHQFSTDPNVVEDLMQEGSIGLISAAKRFNPNRGAAFGTYAAYWIKQKIRRYLQNHRSLIRIPCHQFGAKSKNSRYKEQVNNALTGIFSLSDTVYHEEDFDIKDENAVDPLEDSKNRASNLLVSNLMKETLDEREQVILSERFNLENKHDRPVSLESLGERFNVTRERIRQIEFKALRKLRKKLELKENQ